MKRLFTILFLIISLSAMSQTISGYVYDEAEDKPLEGAFVYLDGTTLSASTNASGFFTINAGQKYNSALVVSFVGFRTIRVEDPFSYGKPFKVLLREDEVLLDEVVINKKKSPFSRGQMMKAFKEEFLGKSRAGSSCTIENEKDIILYFDEQDNTLHAEAAKPIKIINDRLKYKIDFDLAGFTVAYRAKNLASANIASSYFAGTTFFTDIATKKEKAEKIRRETYLGSLPHLMKTIVAGDWEEQKFKFYIGSFPEDPHKYLSVSDSLTFKKVTLVNAPDVNTIRSDNFEKRDPANKYRGIRFNILYNKEKQSVFEFNKGYFYIDENGLFFPLSELVFGGYLASLKAGDLLPADYKYEQEVGDK